MFCSMDILFRGEGCPCGYCSGGLCLRGGGYVLEHNGSLLECIIVLINCVLCHMLDLKCLIRIVPLFYSKVWIKNVLTITYAGNYDLLRGSLPC